VWSVGVLTSKDQIVYVGSETGVASVDSFSFAFHRSDDLMFGFEGFEDANGILLSSLGTISVNNACLTGFR